MTLPEKVWLKRGEIINAGLGITKRDLRKVIDEGALEGRAFPGCKYRKYRREDVMRVFGIKQPAGGRVNA